MGSVLGLQDDGMIVVQPNGRRFRVPQWIAEHLLVGAFVTRYLYRGLHSTSLTTRLRIVSSGTHEGLMAPGAP